VKQVPADRIVAHLEGVWRKQIRWRRKGEKVGCWIPDGGLGEFGLEG
jgi:hypothetical protein